MNCLLPFFVASTVLAQYVSLVRTPELTTALDASLGQYRWEAPPHSVLLAPWENFLPPPTDPLHARRSARLAVLAPRASIALKGR